MKSEIRKDYFLNRYVIHTPQRAKRPRETKTEASIVDKKKCPFCPASIEKKLVIKYYPQEKRWRHLVLKNKYPVVTPDNPKAFGFHEVVVETPNHHQDLSQIPLNNLESILKVFRDRTIKISQNKKIKYVLIFKNEGGKAGASLIHTHSQIFASSLLPPDIAEERKTAKNYKKEKGICPYCDILTKEEKSPRLILANKELVAFTPYASAYHYEAWIFLRRHFGLDNITHLNKKELFSLARTLKLILTKISYLNLSYNFFIHQVIDDSDEHFHLKIQPRVSVWGGIELGTGIVVNSILPEKAARFYRT